ncbi:MAG: type II toxin-antitoxin system prevent-host-death family antitoxin [Sulfuricurvum sp.]|uniref:type II toxin-antitoxin system Phd/YefM family antitoxin n=1 Tax=Sulfuricurvum sp. TaxID=2025608 RepID=UPI00263A0412|nr:type II toxin-antitoxin system prevent-host-death family antitoxin [Sulfuricurvum sp.]MDD2369172.1 type II toxin-antitoxin system prevent-host-death family antitoxin [Sulfuricurvum sp.]MDD2950330.1 type II toxin-antitoxin system prevent-host-death family antitoxin [Sulfuricurvum sp.]MDD5117307.1 type II toxin-antitoxin system prevent-host-death family antitoxin [Sulfuricurvum sp.]
MQAMFYSTARNNLRSMIDSVCKDCEEYIITTKDNQSAVLISYEEYASMKETMYLLSSKTNRDRLLDSIEEIENGHFTVQEIAS